MDKATENDSQIGRKLILSPLYSSFVLVDFGEVQPISGLCSLLCGQGSGFWVYRADSPAPVSILVWGLGFRVEGLGLRVQG